MEFEFDDVTQSLVMEPVSSFDPVKIRGSYYEILGVDPSSSSLQIREAYFRLKSAYTDSNQAIYSLMNEADLADRIRQIESAFDTLRDVDSRSLYNQSIGIEKRTSTSRVDQLIEEISFSNLDEEVRKSQREPVAHKIKVTAGQIRKDQVLAERIRQIFDQDDQASGLTLKAMREAAFVSLEELEANTKVGLNKLKLIETDQFSMMPAPVYVRGFLKSILMFYGISESKQFIDGYIARLESCLKKMK